MINHQPLVSTIIIFLNEEKFIQEAIESVLAQTYDNWELLLVDDGSTDSSTQITQQYAEQHPGKVHYLEHDKHQNRGMSASRNLGIRNAQGKYIALLDADDVWLPQKLEKQVSILESQPEAAIVYGPTQLWFSWTGNPQDAQRDRQESLGAIQLDTLLKPPIPVTLLLQGKITPAGTHALIRRQVVEDVGGFEESFRNMFEDQAFFAKVCLQAAVFVESGSWDKYRQHPQNFCNVAQTQGQYHPTQPNSARLNFLEWLENYLSEQRIKDAEIWQALKTALLPYRHPNLYHLLKNTNYLKGKMKGLVKSLAQQALPAPIHARLRAKWHGAEYCPPVGAVKFGSLRRLTPISRIFGFDRGQPVDRYYMEKFLASHAEDIRGRVLEIGDNSYTQQFGSDRVTQSDILHPEAGNPEATIVGDLAHAEHIPSDSFDCFILTQTLQYLYDLRSAAETVYRILKPGGVALVTLPGITPAPEYNWSWYWSFTQVSAQLLFEEFFPKTHLKVETYGNVLAATAVLQGLAIGEVEKKELDYHDPSYQLLVTVRAEKPQTISSPK
ncbi:MAG: glycosyltransferase [Symploca sp. SIO3E6]|nr:glycosyltransferase [Caldora sp. SIO3E6]